MASYPIPSSFSTPFTYNVTIDGANYSITIFYQYYGKRLYFTLSDNNGIVILTNPLISSNGDIDNLAYLFTSKLYYSASDQVMVII